MDPLKICIKKMQRPEQIFPGSLEAQLERESMKEGAVYSVCENYHSNYKNKYFFLLKLNPQL